MSLGKCSVFVLVLGLCVLLVPSMPRQAEGSNGSTIGPGTLPSWEGDAQVKLGWVFEDPTDPGETDPLDGWDTAVGGAPEWDYAALRKYTDPGGNDQPAQWYVRIPNVINENPSKKFWLAYVYERDPFVSGSRTATNIEWSPATGAQGYEINEVWFDTAGNVTKDSSLAKHGRVTASATLEPNPNYEDLWLGLWGDSSYRIVEVYILTQCPNQPPTIVDASADPDVLWPPNHKMVEVTVTAECEDDYDDDPECEIVAVTSSQPENGLGDGDTAPDWEYIDDEPMKVLLRAESVHTISIL